LQEHAYEIRLITSASSPGRREAPRPGDPSFDAKRWIAGSSGAKTALRAFRPAMTRELINQILYQILHLSARCDGAEALLDHHFREADDGIERGVDRA
jgi:hypothetical protein